MGDNGRRRETTLTAQQLQILDSLSEGSTVTEAAAVAGVHRSTASTWLNDPSHPLAIAWTKASDEAVDHARRNLRRNTDRAVSALVGVLTSKDSKGSEVVAAAREILGRAGVSETTRQELAVDAGRMAVVAKLEAVFAAGVDGDDVLEALDQPAIEGDD